MGTGIGTLERGRKCSGSARLVALTCAALGSLTAYASAQQGKAENTQAGSRAEVTIGDTSVGSENLTSTSDGTLFFGSSTKGTMASPRSTRSSPRTSEGEFEDFFVGFVTPEGNVWGRPAGVAVAKDGSLMITDDGSGTVWRVAYTGKM